MNINFRAKYLNSSIIQKYNPEKNSYEDFPVNLIQLENKRKSDSDAVYYTYQCWRGMGYTGNIISTAQDLYKKRLSEKIYQVLAVTSQKTNLKNLDGRKILCLAEIQKLSPNDIEINFLQTDPDIIYTIENRPFKGIGTSFLKMLKNLDYVKSIILTSSCNLSTRKFYEKNDFTLIDKNKLRYYWKKV